MKFLVFAFIMLGTACLVLASGFTLPTVVALTVLLLAVTVDFLTTWLCLRARGREGNPLVAILFRKLGVLGTFCMMVGIWTAFIALRWIHQTDSIQTAIAIAYWLVPVNNVMVLARLRKKNSQTSIG